MQEKRKYKKTSREEQYRTRLAIVALVQEGISGKEIARQLDISEGYVSRIKKDFEENGYDALQLYEKGSVWGREL